MAAVIKAVKIRDLIGTNKLEFRHDHHANHRTKVPFPQLL